jgi:signal transduction histidine kinase
VSISDTAARSETIAVLAPTGRDAKLACRVLGRWSIEAQTFADHTALVEAIRRGVGAVILAEEALVAPVRNAIVAELDAQPSWSDLPLIILTAEGELSRAITESIESIAARSNVTLLERPVRIATLVTIVRSALRARARQYDVRDHLVLLNEARAEAEGANRAKSDFLAMMSHELRTPLNAIGGYADLMLLGIRGAITDEQREDLTRIRRSQRHLLGLINGVLNFARIERGAVQYDMTDVSLAELLAAAEPLVAPQAQARGLTIEFESGTPLRARADRDKLQQVVLNLLGNAIKFTEPGGRVRVRCEARANGRVAIIVQDTGYGIAADKLETIFEPFVQVDSRFTQTRDGVGLGLAISRDLACGMGGDLTVESELSVGSTFILTLVAA